MILHIDMDAFYASIEQLDNPELVGKCVIVGGLSDRSVVSAASYEARKFGVRSAMPMVQAKQKCPQAIIQHPRMERYKEISRKIMSQLETFSPLVEPVSIDEAYMDITGCQKLFGHPHNIAAAIKKKIKEAVHLNCSIGIAPNKMLAKVASDMDKPDGLFVITPDKTKEFIDNLPIQKVPGIGKTTQKKLYLLGIKTLADIKKAPKNLISKKLGKFGNRLLDLSKGIDDSPVTPISERKSVSTESTLSQDTNEMAVLKKYLLMQSESVGRQLRKLEMPAKTITLKIKYADFKQKTRSYTMTSPTQSSDIIYKEVVNLLKSISLKNKIRLIGVGASGLLNSKKPIQMELFTGSTPKKPKWEQVDKTVDDIIGKYGKGAINRATLQDKPPRPKKDKREND